MLMSLFFHAVLIARLNAKELFTKQMPKIGIYRYQYQYHNIANLLLITLSLFYVLFRLYSM